MILLFDYLETVTMNFQREKWENYRENNFLRSYFENNSKTGERIIMKFSLDPRVKGFEKREKFVLDSTIQGKISILAARILWPEEN